uniref:Uncharacterized protein n=1 Tax=Arundo donax TaxID=35708 RepID=A0A0A9VAY6_ARUDO
MLCLPKRKIKMFSNKFEKPIPSIKEILANQLTLFVQIKIASFNCSLSSDVSTMTSCTLFPYRARSLCLGPTIGAMYTWKVGANPGL